MFLISSLLEMGIFLTLSLEDLFKNLNILFKLFFGYVNLFKTVKFDISL